MSTFILAATCLLIGMCAGIHLEYRNGYLDRRLHKPWPKPRPVRHADYIDECTQFNMAMLDIGADMRAIEAPETIQ